MRIGWGPNISCSVKDQLNPIAAPIEGVVIMGSQKGAAASCAAKTGYTSTKKSNFERRKKFQKTGSNALALLLTLVLVWQVPSFAWGDEVLQDNLEAGGVTLPTAADISSSSDTGANATDESAES